MSEESKLLELELEMLDISRRIGRLEGDYSAMNISLKNIQEQVTISNANFDRFWEHEWPTISKAITDTNAKLALVAEKAVEERISSAVAAEKAKGENEARAKETQALKTDVDAQKNLLIKMLGGAILAGGASSGVVQLLSSLLGGN